LDGKDTRSHNIKRLSRKLIAQLETKRPVLVENDNQNQ